MLFSRASTSILSRSRNLVNKSVVRAKSSSAPPTEEAAEAGGSLAVAVATTFGTYMIADFLSNFIQHPFHKVSADDR
jgi:hypothetical protein